MTQPKGVVPADMPVQFVIPAAHVGTLLEGLNHMPHGQVASLYTSIQQQFDLACFEHIRKTKTPEQVSEGKPEEGRPD